jgi:hypothetical protein
VASGPAGAASILAACVFAFTVGCGGSSASDDTGSASTTGGETVGSNAVGSNTVGSNTVGSNTNAPPPEHVEAPFAIPGRSGSGARPEDPITACGPEDSYRLVAGEVQCPGGGNPLGGDPTLGAQARVGNVGAGPEGHIIDHYRVPCPTGPLDVFVDMYGCPQMEEMLRSFGGP